MSKKIHPVAQVLKLIETLDTNELEIVRAFLRAPRKSSPKSPSPARSAGKKSSSGRVPQTAGDLNIETAKGTATSVGGSVGDYEIKS